MKKQFQITYEIGGAAFRDDKKDEKTLQEVMDCLYENGSVIIGDMLYMAKHIIKIERFE